MRITLLVTSLLLLVACDEARDGEARPDPIFVRKIEHSLKDESCIGDLSEWERRYQFKQELNKNSKRYGDISYDEIFFALRRGDKSHPIRPGIQIFSSKSGFIGEIDDRPGRSARGKFDVGSGRVTLDSCGYSAGG